MFKLIVILFLGSVCLTSCNSKIKNDLIEEEKKQIKKTNDEIDSVNKIDIEPVERKEYDLTHDPH